MADPGSARPRATSRALLALLAVCAAVTAALVYIALEEGGDEGPIAVVEEQAGPFRGGALPEGLTGAPAPSFSATDARGGEFGTADLAGMPYVVTFLYTECPDVCPLIAQELRQALEILGPRADRVAVIAVSVDPVGDTPEAVRAWLERNELPRNFHYLVGPEQELSPVWEDYFASPQPAGEPESRHTASIWLVDADGRLRTKFSGGIPVAPADIAHDLGLLIDDAGRRGRAPDATS